MNRLPQNLFIVSSLCRCARFLAQLVERQTEDLRVIDGSILEFIWALFSDEAYAVKAGFMSNSIMVMTESILYVHVL